MVSYRWSTFAEKQFQNTLFRLTIIPILVIFKLMCSTVQKWSCAMVLHVFWMPFRVFKVFLWTWYHSQRNALFVVCLLSYLTLTYVTNTHNLFQFHQLSLWQMAMIRQFDRCKKVFVHQQGDSQSAFSWRPDRSWYGVPCGIKKFEETGQFCPGVKNYVQQKNEKTNIFIYCISISKYTGS